MEYTIASVTVVAERSRSRKAIGFLLLCSFGVVGCGDPAPVQKCHYGQEILVHQGSGSYIREVSLEGDHRGLLAAWTDASGTWVRPLDTQGNARSTAVKVGPAAQSLSLAKSNDGFSIGLIRPGHLIWAKGAAYLRRLGPSGNPLGDLEVLGRAGVYSEGISVASGEDHGIVLWNDGVPGDLSIRAAPFGSKSIRLSRENMNACCPFVTSSVEGFIALWGEYSFDKDDSSIMLQKFSKNGALIGKAQTLIKTKVNVSWPSLVSSEDEMSLIYRDKRQGDRLEQLFFARFDHRAEPLQEPKRLGRFDGKTQATLLRTGNVFFALAVRSWSKEMILGVNRFNPQGQRIGAEFHVFF